jgi:hypothetical protein
MNNITFVFVVLHVYLAPILILSSIILCFRHKAFLAIKSNLNHIFKNLILFYIFLSGFSSYFEINNNSYSITPSDVFIGTATLISTIFYIYIYRTYKDLIFIVTPLLCYILYRYLFAVKSLDNLNTIILFNLFNMCILGFLPLYITQRRKQ